jgi:protein-disulfide isomerase
LEVDSFSFVIISGLVILQYIQIELLNQRNIKLSKYDPLSELEKFEAKPIYNITLDHNIPLIGNEDAPVKMVVFSDFQCSSCAIFSQNINDLINYNKGNLKIYFKHFPLGQGCNPKVKQEMHPFACEAAKAAIAAQWQGKFWEFHDTIFHHFYTGEKAPDILNLAKSTGINIDKFLDDINSDSINIHLLSDINEALKLEIDYTPAVFLNGRKVNDLRPNSLNFLIKYLSH